MVRDRFGQPYDHFARDRTKNRQKHIVPLSDFAMNILMDIEHDDREHVFGRTRGVGFSGWAKPKEELDRVLTLDQPRTLHDLRRTVRTGLGKLGMIVSSVIIQPR